MWFMLKWYRYYWNCGVEVVVSVVSGGSYGVVVGVERTRVRG